MTLGRVVLTCLLLALAPAVVVAAGFEGGHTKLQWLGSSYPADSLFRPELGSRSQDGSAELRLKLRTDSAPWSIVADYQLIARRGDSLALAGGDGLDLLLPPGVPDDAGRWWNLTHQISESGDRAVVQRLDRLHLDYAGDTMVVRFGRQAVSWGNGLIYNPMDVFNPFDPAAVDTEYKFGDDMLYAQYLTDAGNDWQFVQVVRRNAHGQLSSGVNSSALKYHGFGNEREYDLLLAQHYGELLLGAGGSTNMGGAVLRGDVTLAETATDWVASLVASWSYSWVWGGRNTSVVAEYFYNGFGQRESGYAPEEIRRNTDLLARLERGELFTLGRHYLGASVPVEVTPLLTVTPNLFVNLGDNSALAQVVAQWSVGQDWQVLASANFPMGATGSEYGGLETGIDGLTLATGPAVFAQLAWYF